MRTGRRLQRTLLAGAASGFVLSPDPQQRFIYMIDGVNHHVWILNRATLEVVARFGQQGLFDDRRALTPAMAGSGVSVQTRPWTR